MTLKGEEHSGQGKLTMASEQQDEALEAALRQAIRAQYHFRASEKGLLAWDVRRLVRLSRDLPVQAVALGEIAELDQVHWYGHDAASPTVRSVVAHCQLMMAADLAYPILLDSAGRVMDGMHRVGKALLLGHSHIEARRFAVDPAPDYQGCDPDTLPYDD
ncbi:MULTISPECIES: hypothetical protein [Aeromonas]|uniref:hypothetical protein n=1 Tax=Aeromonas TaxID=642 RepID=UPI0004D79E24|nr:hypothetical protein [Aeromonas hydrophila]KER61689.1 hypothetical protein HR52_01075 [Aeromonas hydrophila]TNI68907.1 hypothetical protein CF124_00505 [Aeromonas hydrophila]CAD7554149.1 hypothetical protein KBAH04_35100 [Aeromonas hydrophila]HAU4874280.1 hypothetical protein [Aeromonas hydrophila]